MSKRFLDALHSGRVILMDGAMGTELIRRGLDTETESSADWNTCRPEDVRDVHRLYLEAGAHCLLTNTFLPPLGPDRPNTVDRAVELVSKLTDEQYFVMLDSGPTQLRVHERSMAVDAMLLETLDALSWLRLLSWTVNSPFFPPVVSFSYRLVGRGLYCGGDESTPETVAEFVHRNRSCFLALGVNCGRDMDMDAVIDVVRRYRKVTDLPILARPNAGTPIQIGDRWVYPHSPKSMAAKLPALIEAGATLIGGCCGTTPAHIAAFREVIDKMGVGWKP
jgi:5-methyltetrahydrofolate--homocysteine methyltransferase